MHFVRVFNGVIPETIPTNFTNKLWKMFMVCLTFFERTSVCLNLRFYDQLEENRMLFLDNLKNL